MQLLRRSGGMPERQHRLEGSRSSRALCTACCEDVHLLNQEDRINVSNGTLLCAGEGQGAAPRPGSAARASSQGDPLCDVVLAGLLPSTGLTGASKRATMPPNGSSGLWPLEERVISLRRQRRVVRAKVPARTNTHPTSHDRDRVAVLNRESACVKQGRVTNEACLGAICA